VISDTLALVVSPDFPDSRWAYRTVSGDPSSEPRTWPQSLGSFELLHDEETENQAKMREASRFNSLRSSKKGF
ncbi:hypothetical protein CYMTET_26016, partial [Cymbomonas tetramitiformis]